MKKDRNNLIAVALIIFGLAGVLSLLLVAISYLADFTSTSYSNQSINKSAVFSCVPINVTSQVEETNVNVTWHLVAAECYPRYNLTVIRNDDLKIISEWAQAYTVEHPEVLNRSGQ